MASFPLDDCVFSTDFCGFSPSIPAENLTDAIWGEESFPFIRNIGAINTLMPPSVFGTSYPALMDISGPAFTQFDMGLCGISGMQSSRVGYEPAVGVYNKVDEKSNGFASDFQSVYGDHNVQAIQGNLSPAVEEPSLKVGRYSFEERKDRIIKYLKKRNQRNFNKTIKYACRKTLADRRVRVRGRFARNNEVRNEAMATKNHHHHHLHEQEFYDDGSLIKLDGEEWLQDAVASLVYLPIFVG